MVSDLAVRQAAITSAAALPPIPVQVRNAMAVGQAGEHCRFRQPTDCYPKNEAQEEAVPQPRGPACRPTRMLLPENRFFPTAGAATMNLANAPAQLPWLVQ